jgi:lipoprotein-releasing system permease protein
MNLKTEFFLAFKYLRPKRNAVSVITCISIVGVTLGVAVLLVVLAVMTGFTDLMKDKLMQTGAHLQIYNKLGGCIENTQEDVAILAENNVEATPVINAPILVQKRSRFVPKMVLGIEPDNIPKKFDLKGALTTEKFDLSRRKVIVSETVAREMGLYVGSKVLIHSPQRLAQMIRIDKGGSFDLQTGGDVYLPMEFTVSGLYSFKKHDFDKQILFMNLDDADELFGVPWGAANIIYGWVPDPFNMKKLVKTLKEQLPGRDFVTWKKLNQRLLGVLEVEKDMMFFLLIFIVLVAAFSITNTLITVVIQKTREIGLLKAVGASSGVVMRVFLLQGFIVGFFGSIFGTLLGATVLYFRNNALVFMRNVTGRDLFPKEFYFFNELPANMVTTDVVFVCLVSIVLCTIGALIPAWRAASLDPAKALRYE